jgi:tetratricopeptide (TPR) repeat protein
MKLAPADPVPPVNLCDARAAAGRDAVAEAERMTASAQPSVAAAAHYWLGWHHKGQPDTNDRAIDHLRHAIQGRWRWGLAHANLAHALEMAHRSDEAYQQHGTALDCDDDFDRAFSHERRAAYEARHGWLRNALRSFRAALREDRKRGGEREITYRDAIAWLEQQLRAAGIEPATPDRDGSDERWLRACALELPAGFGARTDAGEPLADDVIEVERLVRAERWEAAVHQLELLRRADLGKLFDAAGYAAEGAEAARRTGHRAHALAMLRLVLEAYRAHASWATSGAEAMGRMVDVDRISAQLVSWESEGK